MPPSWPVNVFISSQVVQIIFTAVSSHRLDQLLTQTPASSALEAESSKLLLKVWCFWQPVPHPEAVPEPTKNHLIRTKGVPILEKCQGIWKLCARNQRQTPNSTTKNAPVTLCPLGNCQGFRSSVPGAKDKDQI